MSYRGAHRAIEARPRIPENFRSHAREILPSPIETCFPGLVARHIFAINGETHIANDALSIRKAI